VKCQPGDVAVLLEWAKALLLQGDLGRARQALIRARGWLPIIRQFFACSSRRKEYRWLKNTAAAINVVFIVIGKSYWYDEDAEYLFKFF